MTTILSRTPLCTSTEVGLGATVYSDSINFSKCQGEATVWLSSTAGRITVTQQCSINDVDWYDPVDTAAAALGAVASLVTVTTGRYVSYTPVIAPFIRYKIVENLAATVVNLILIFREEE